MKIFVLSDTHNRLPEKLRGMAERADEIWHLGDVCAPNILAQVETFGPPVSVVRGNCDDTFDWPLVLNLQRCGLRFQLVHIPPSGVPSEADVVLHGHTHVPRDEVRGGVRFLNPGCVTRPNRGSPASVAILQIGKERAITWRLIPLA